MPSVFERSVLNISGGESFAIVLPIQWVRYYGIKPGDKLEVIANGELRIRPLPKGEETADKQGEES